MSIGHFLSGKRQTRIVKVKRGITDEKENSSHVILRDGSINGGL